MPSAWRLNCMNTLFQISTKRSPSSSGVPRWRPPQMCSPRSEDSQYMDHKDLCHPLSRSYQIQTCRSLCRRDANNLVSWDAHFFVPDIECFVICLVNLVTNRRSFGRPSVSVRKFQAKLNSLLLWSSHQSWSYLFKAFRRMYGDEPWNLRFQGHCVYHPHVHNAEP